MISDKYKCIFVHIPKCGGTSIEKTLNGRIWRHAHVSLSNYKRRFNNKYPKYFKFTFVRNPWDKFASEYRWFTNSKYAYPVGHVKRYYRPMSFEQFLDAFLKFPYDKGDSSHRLSYTSMLNPIEDIDFIGRFENYEEDLRKVYETLGVKVGSKLPHKYKTPKKHYTEYYNVYV